jgi:hypothetical protein
MLSGLGSIVPLLPLRLHLNVPVRPAAALATGRTFATHHRAHRYEWCIKEERRSVTVR